MNKLHGIVLRTVRYGDNGYIVDLFTDAYGRMSVMMKRSAGGKRKGSRVVPSLFMPLSMVEFECDVHALKGLPQPKEMGFYHQYSSLTVNPVKMTLSMFLAEFLANAIKEESENRLLFQYVEDSLLWLDCAERGFANFHLVFLSRLTRFIGIFPNVDKSDANLVRTELSRYFFDLLNCEFRIGQPSHPYFLRPEEARTLPYMLHMNYDNMHLYGLSRQQRQRCLEVLNDYYRIHLPGFAELKSLEILREIFD
ncbi:MAG: DNA repair protein RecO [Bacteroidaceae bacterium]|nr:DNA repair protein RecO [Bacteroidaceae bacterium]